MPLNGFLCAARITHMQNAPRAGTIHMECGQKKWTWRLVRVRVRGRDDHARTRNLIVSNAHRIKIYVAIANSKMEMCTQKSIFATSIKTHRDMRGRAADLRVYRRALADDENAAPAIHNVVHAVPARNEPHSAAPHHNFFPRLVNFRGFSAYRITPPCFSAIIFQLFFRISTVFVHTRKPI